MVDGPAVLRVAAVACLSSVLAMGVIAPSQAATSGAASTGAATPTSTSTAVTSTPRVFNTFVSSPIPTVSGTHSYSVGSVLTASAGTWVPSATLSYQWRRDGVAINGATMRTYTLTSSDGGHKINVSVVGRRTGYTSITRTSTGMLVAFAQMRTAISTASVPSSIADTRDHTLPGPTSVPAPSPSTSFQAGYIISDAMMTNSMAMTESQVQAFLSAKGAACAQGSDGSPCLKNYMTSAPVSLSAPYCTSVTFTAGESAASIITRSGVACGINPQVLIVLLQKEQGLVTSTNPTASNYTKATGFRCPDSGGCLGQYAGFENQVYGAAGRLVQYGREPGNFTFHAGQTASIAYNPNASCGSSAVTISNWATAALYNYTPYQPNAAALANLYGSGDSCSAYGNRNFWRSFRDWFGNPAS